MAGKPRVAPGGLVYHVLNRSAGKIKLLSRDKDFQAFENLLVEAHARHPDPDLRLLPVGNALAFRSLAQG